jgi:hypothetical protein
MTWATVSTNPIVTANGATPSPMRPKCAACGKAVPAHTAAVHDLFDEFEAVNVRDALWRARAQCIGGGIRETFENGRVVRIVEHVPDELDKTRAELIEAVALFVGWRRRLLFALRYAGTKGDTPWE